MSKTLARLLVLLLFAMPSLVQAQGLLIDVAPDRRVRLPRPIIMPHPRPFPRPVPRPTSYKIKEIDVQVTLTDQVAKVQVTQAFVNTGSRQMEVAFLFPLPYDGAVDRLTFMVDGREYEAKLLPAKEARGIYEAIVRKNRDPALLEWMGTGMFKTSVFPVPPGAERRVSLRYSQLCRKDSGLTDFVFPLSTAKYTDKAVEKVNFRLAINSRDAIKNVYSPTHKVDISRPTNDRAVVSYSVKNEVPTSDFRLIYDVGSKAVGTSVLSYRPKSGEDGYLLMLASPAIKATAKEQPRKSVIFVVDRSGSMSGKKIEQAKGALKFVLNNLRDGDLFNIVVYDSVVESFAPELQKFDDVTRKKALGFVEGIYAGGSTNISGALAAALGQLKDNKQPSYVIFLTDGLPTAGEKNEAKIVEGTKKQNQVRARVFSFGVGYDVNSRLLDRLVRSNHGQSAYVRPNENIESRVATLYSKIGSPVMTDVAITVDVEGGAIEDGKVINRMYPKGTVDLFAGQQLVIVGRYAKTGNAKVTVRGKVGGKELSFDFPAKLVASSGDETYAFVEKLWAVRRVGELIDEMDLQGKNDELIKELVTLSTKHGILTPYTSFLADENSNFKDLSGNVGVARKRLDALAEASGKRGFAQRRAKAAFQHAGNAPAAGLALLPTADDKTIRVRSVRNIGNKTFYRRDNRWIDEEVDEKKQAAGAKDVVKIERYSKEFFALFDKHGKKIRKYLAIDEPVVIKLGDTVYSF